LKRCLRARIISATRNRNRTNVNLTSHNVTISQKRFLRLEPEGRFDNLALGDGPLCKGLGLPSPAPAFLESQARWVWESRESGSLGKLGSWEVGKVGTHHPSPNACVPAQEKAIPLSVCGRGKKTRRTAMLPADARKSSQADGGDRGSAKFQQKTGLWEFFAERRKATLDVCALRTAQQDCPRITAGSRAGVRHIAKKYKKMRLE
jgi:hypothetical protein